MASVCMPRGQVGQHSGYACCMKLPRGDLIRRQPLHVQASRQTASNTSRGQVKRQLGGANSLTKGGQHSAVLRTGPRPGG